MGEAGKEHGEGLFTDTRGTTQRGTWSAGQLSQVLPSSAAHVPRSASPAEGQDEHASSRRIARAAEPEAKERPESSESGSEDESDGTDREAAEPAWYSPQVNYQASGSRRSAKSEGCLLAGNPTRSCRGPS